MGKALYVRSATAEDLKRHGNCVVSVGSNSVPRILRSQKKPEPETQPTPSAEPELSGAEKAAIERKKECLTHLNAEVALVRAAENLIKAGGAKTFEEALDLLHNGCWNPLDESEES